MAGGVVVRALQPDGRLVQQALHHRARDGLDPREVARRRALPATLVLGEDPVDDVRAVLAQRRDRRQHVELGHPPREALDLLLDDRLGPRALARAHLEVARDDRLQVVDVVERDALDIAALGLDVARHRDVDEHERPAVALLHDERDVVGGDERVRRGGRGGGDVCGREPPGGGVRGGGRPAETGRPGAGAGGGGGGGGERPAPPKRSASARARPAWRLAMKIVVTPWSASVCAVRSLVSPAPMTTTLRWARSPTASRASSTATVETLTRWRPIPVCVRTRLPASSAARNRRFVIGPVVPAARASS